MPLEFVKKENYTKEELVTMAGDLLYKGVSKYSPWELSRSCTKCPSRSGDFTAHRGGSPSSEDIASRRSYKLHACQAYLLEVVWNRYWLKSIKKWVKYHMLRILLVLEAWQGLTGSRK